MKLQHTNTRAHMEHRSRSKRDRIENRGGKRKIRVERIAAAKCEQTKINLNHLSAIANSSLQFDFPSAMSIAQLTNIYHIISTTIDGWVSMRFFCD